MRNHRSIVVSAGLLAPCCAMTCTVEAGDPQFTTTLVANVASPRYVTHAPGDADRIFILEKAGRIHILKNGALLPEPFLDMSDQVQINGGHDGLLCAAFHPDYQNNGYFYVHFTVVPDAGLTVARFEVSADPNIALADSMEIVQGPTHTSGHRGSWIGFGPNDGYLYVFKGDGGPGGDSPAQDLDVLLGKVLRLDVNGDDFPKDDTRNYAIPLDNPFVGASGADEIWAYGLRQPWRGSFDRDTGDLYIADVGRFNWEEVNVQPAASSGGENYGWDCQEAAACFGGQNCECKDPSLTHPIFAYPHPDPDFGAAVIGGYVYRGKAIPELHGAYIFADHFVGDGGKIWSLRHDGIQVTELVEIQDALNPEGLIGKITAFGEDFHGELYICDHLGGEVFKIVPSEACPWDLDGSADVGIVDFLDLLAQWGTDPGGPPDFDGDGIVGITDFLLLLANWGKCP